MHVCMYVWTMTDFKCCFSLEGNVMYSIACRVGIEAKMDRTMVELEYGEGCGAGGRGALKPQSRTWRRV